MGTPAYETAEDWSDRFRRLVARLEEKPTNYEAFPPRSEYPVRVNLIRGANGVPTLMYQYPVERYKEGMLCLIEDDTGLRVFKYDPAQEQKFSPAVPVDKLYPDGYDRYLFLAAVLGYYDDPHTDLRGALTQLQSFLEDELR